MTRRTSEALERLIEPFDGEAGDWADVLERAGAARRGRRRPATTLAFAAALIVAVLALAPPFGLAGRIIGLFDDRGKPVPVASLTPSDREALIFSMCRRLRLVTPSGKAPEKRCLDGEPRIEEVANNGTRLYWKATFPSGLTCLASGSVRGYREYGGGGRSHVGMMGCGRGVLPTPKRPITVDAPMQFRIGDRRVRLIRASGLAGQGIASVGLVEKGGGVLKAQVRGRTYDFERPPNRAWEWIAAFDDSGKEVYRESLHLEALPQPRHGQQRRPQPVPLIPLPKGSPVQHGEAPGASIDVYRSSLVAVHLSAESRAYRLLRPRQADPRVGIACSKLAYGAGRWETLGSGSYGTFGHEIRAVVSPVRLGGGRGPRPPFDACWMSGTYGLRWNDARGMHDAVEVSFSALGRRFFGEKAAARDLALFMRTPEMRAIRKAMVGARPPSGTEIARRFPSRVVGLKRRTSSADSPDIGVWSNERDLIVVSRRANDGRRLFVTLRSGRFGPNNLAGLTGLFY